MEEQLLKEIEMLKREINLLEGQIELYKKLLKEKDKESYIATTPWTQPITPVTPWYDDDRIDPDWYKKITCVDCDL